MYHYMTSGGYIIMIIVDSCLIWIHLDCIMQSKVAEKVLLLLVISLTSKETNNIVCAHKPCPV